MKQPKWLLKVAAVASSVLLLAGFVCYRAGAFNWLRGTEAPPADGGSIPGAEPGLYVTVPLGEATGNGLGLDPILSYSSKAGTIFPPPTPAQQVPPGTPQPGTGGPAIQRVNEPGNPQSAPLLSGSKSAVIFTPPSANPPAPPPAAPAKSSPLPR